MLANDSTSRTTSVQYYIIILHVSPNRTCLHVRPRSCLLLDRRTHAVEHALHHTARSIPRGCENSIICCCWLLVCPHVLTPQQ
jgi:hypothetical protein